MIASKNGHVDVVNILLGNKAQVSSQNNKGECTMMNAPPKCGNRVVFKVELYSTHTNDKESQSITFEGNPPVTIASIKEKERRTSTFQYASRVSVITHVH